MQKTIIGALVGAIILFLWQFLSFGVINLHSSQMAYSPQQDAVMQAMADANLEEGEFFMPMPPPSASEAEMQEHRTQMEGKPWALVKYRKAYHDTMAMNMIRGLAVDFIAVFLLCWMLGKMSGLNLQTTVMVSVAVGLIGYLSIVYIDGVWFEGSTIPDLIDAIVAWGLIGGWLGWWMNRGKQG